jgi:tmRNA-binding protein
MNPIFEKQKRKWKKEAEELHDKLSHLFKENRFLFELETRKLIEEAINFENDERQKEKLSNCQKNIERILKNAGSDHNRLVLMKMLFWETVNDRFRPLLNGGGKIDFR